MSSSGNLPETFVVVCGGHVRSAASEMCSPLPHGFVPCRVRSQSAPACKAVLSRIGELQLGGLAIGEGGRRGFPRGERDFRSNCWRIAMTATDLDHDESSGSQGRIVANLVPDEARLGCLPKHFGHRMMLLEQTVYAFMREFVGSYRGGYWDFFELSNGGFYMAPKISSPTALSVASNGFEAEMTPDAAGIVACLFAYSHLSFRCPDDSPFGNYYHLLLDFAGGHREAGLIFRAID